MAKAKTQKLESELVAEQVDTDLVMFKFNRNVNVGGILVSTGESLEIKLSDAKIFKMLNVGEVVKVGE